MLLNKITPLYFVVSCSGTRFALESSSLQRLVVSGPYVNTGALPLYRWCSREGCKRLASTKFRLQHKCHPCCANNRRVSLSDFPCRWYTFVLFPVKYQESPSHVSSGSHARASIPFFPIPHFLTYYFPVILSLHACVHTSGIFGTTIHATLPVGFPVRVCLLGQYRCLAGAKKTFVYVFVPDRVLI